MQIKSSSESGEGTDWEEKSSEFMLRLWKRDNSCEKMRAAVHEYGDLRDREVEVNSVGNPSFWFDLVANGEEETFRIAETEDSKEIEWPLHIGKALLIYCTDSNLPNELYNFDTLLYYSILTSESFTYNATNLN